MYEILYYTDKCRRVIISQEATFEWILFILSENLWFVNLYPNLWDRIVVRKVS